MLVLYIEIPEVLVWREDDRYHLGRKESVALAG